MQKELQAAAEWSAELRCWKQDEWQRWQGIQEPNFDRCFTTLAFCERAADGPNRCALVRKKSQTPGNGTGQVRRWTGIVASATGPANCGYSHKPKDSLQMYTVWKGPLLHSTDFKHMHTPGVSTVSTVIYCLWANDSSFVSPDINKVIVVLEIHSKWKRLFHKYFKMYIWKYWIVLMGKFYFSFWLLKLSSVFKLLVCLHDTEFADEFMAITSDTIFE